MKKNKKVVSSEVKLPTKDPLKMVMMAWALSVLVFPAISILVPGYFGDNLNYLADDTATIIERVFYGIGVVNVPILIISIIVGLALIKEFSAKFTLPRLLRHTLVVATVLNVCFAILTISML